MPVNETQRMFLICIEQTKWFAKLF